MRKVIFFLIISIGVMSAQAFSSEQQIPNRYEDIDFYEKVMALDPYALTPEQFYELEKSIICLFSGSGGYHLGEDEINWIRKTTAAFEARNIKLENARERDFVIAWSYFSDENYQKALEEFKNIDYQQGMELAEWFINNKGIKDGVVNIKEYPGPFEDDMAEVKAEDNRYVFAAYFKGPVYRYDKMNNLHAIIYAPECQYDWCNQLEFKEGKLFIKLRDIGTPGARFVFDNDTHKIAML
ncbi:MAG: hypothetical protein ABII75_05085 [Candidatus Omnitrophota bacterium]